MDRYVNYLLFFEDMFLDFIFVYCYMVGFGFCNNVSRKFFII